MLAKHGRRSHNAATKTAGRCAPLRGAAPNLDDVRIGPPILHRKGAEHGRARGPVRDGVGDADAAAKFDSCFPRSYERGYKPLV